MNDYVKTIYDEKKVSFTSYPEKLINYLVERFKINKNSKILELGPGRGEFLHQFNISGFDTYGVDQSTYGKDKYGLNMLRLIYQKKHFHTKIIILIILFKMLLSIFNTRQNIK